MRAISKCVRQLNQGGSAVASAIRRAVVRHWVIGAYLLLPYAVANLIWKGFRYAPYWNRWRERFGFIRRPEADRVIWVHAVSVGEIRSAAALINALGEKYPGHRILVTTMTPTGSQQVEALFGQRVSHAYVPFDLPDAVFRFLNRARPELAIIAETEFWPNLFASLARRRIPLFLVNVRISEAALDGYLRVPEPVGRMFSKADLICPQTERDARRLEQLGADSERIRITGNLKFDVEVPQSLLHEGAAVRRQWGRDRPVWVAASTHAGEEAPILDALAQLREAYPDLLLAFVPRHPERFVRVTRLCERRGYKVALRSVDYGELGADTDIIIGDTMGELQRLYAASDVAFVGGSLVPNGGQNPLEAFAVRVPVIFGPHMFHFEDISALALGRGAACQVEDAGQLAAAVAHWLDDPQARHAAGEAGHAVMHDNQGALQRTLQLMDDTLPELGLDAARPSES